MNQPYNLIVFRKEHENFGLIVAALDMMLCISILVLQTVKSDQEVMFLDCSDTPLLHLLMLTKGGVTRTCTGITSLSLDQ